MVHERKRTNKRSPIRVNRKLDRSLKRVKKTKHNGGRTLKKNRKNKKKNKFKDYIQKGGANELYHYFSQNHPNDGDIVNGISSDHRVYKPFTYEKLENKYVTFYHKDFNNISVGGTIDVPFRGDLYEMTNFYEFTGIDEGLCFLYTFQRTI